MKNYAKVGNKKGKPAYRTPSSFKIRQSLKIANLKSPKQKQRKKDDRFQNSKKV